MKSEHVDWTLDHIPSDTTETEAARPSQPPPPRVPRRPPRWVLLAVLALTLILGVVGYLYYRIGWARLEAQLQDEVTLEDQYSRARDVGLVQTFLSDEDPAWYRLRAAEAALGWPAPQPAPHLLPLPDEPRVLRVEALADDLFEVTVLRHYADSAGQAYGFELVQRYRNLGPGLWEHVPPAPVGLGSTQTFTGVRLVATYFAADEDSLQQALPQVDAFLQRACADWDCPPDLMVPLAFVKPAPAVLLPTPARTANEASANYPIIFDLTPQSPIYPPRVQVPSPGWVGTPHDALAEEALTRAITVKALAYLAASMADSQRTARDFFLDALIARAEIRLGLSAPVTEALPAEAFLPPGFMWSAVEGGFEGDLHGERPYRLVAVQYLNDLLAGAPPEFDGQLLRSLRQSTGLVGVEPWLSAVLGAEKTQQEHTEWAARVKAAGSAALAWHELEGLLLTCNDGARLIRNQDVVILPSSPFNQAQGHPESLSSDGRYLAYMDYGSSTQLRIMDFETGFDSQVVVDPGMTLFGWSAINHLLFAEFDRSEPSRLPAYLWLYDPISGGRVQPLTQPIWPFSVNWSRDRRSLVLALLDGGSDWKPLGVARVDVVEDGAVTMLVPGGGAPALSPDEGRVAYIRYDTLAGGTVVGAAIELLALESGTQTTLMSPTMLADLLVDAEVGLGSLGMLAWSDDGQWLSFTVNTGSRGAQLFTLAVDGAGWHRQGGVDSNGFVSTIGFSADGQYLAFREIQFAGSNAASTGPVVIRNLQTGATQSLEVQGGSAVWSPTGHKLAVAGTKGVYVIDVGTGQKHWVAFQPCLGVQWYASDR